MDRIMQALRSFKLVQFVNQPRAKKSTPDAKIITSPAIWIETKTSENSVNPDQVTRHLESVENHQKLLLLTPDEHRPTCLENRVIWSNFRQLVSTVQSILGDEDEPPSERESFLLRELVRMVEESGLTTPIESRVLVRAAKIAWPAYEQFSVYYHSGKDPRFRPSGYMAFYTNNEVKPKIAKILCEIESITLKDTSHVQSLEVEKRKFVNQLMEIWESKDKIPQKIRENFESHLAQPARWMFLSGPDDEETVKLSKAIANDLKGQGGKPTAFTQNRRYVTLESLEKAQTTSDLEPG